MTDPLAGRAAYVVAVVVLGLGLVVLVAADHLVRKVLGLALFQTGIFLVFVASAVRTGGRSPLVTDAGGPYVDPLPHVLVLTAIVVGVSVTALAVALVARVAGEQGTVRASAVRVAGDAGPASETSGRTGPANDGSRPE